jgi:2-iminobutanoate/2-iminopropanoate deaminase
MTRADIAATRRIDRDSLLEISGLAAYDEHGQEVFPKDLLKQTRYVLDSLMHPILQEAGAGFDDIARLSVFTTSVREWPAVWAQVRTIFHKPPALTVVEIPRLVGEIAMVELEISAAIPMRQGDSQEVAMASGDTDGAVAILPKSLADRDWKLHAAAFKMGKGDLLFLSGLGPADASGKTVGPDDAGAQTRQILSTMDAILREAGGTIDDVIRLRVFATDMKNRPQINAERAKTFKEPRAVSTFVQVSGLEEDDWLVAMEATAFIPKRNDRA